MPDPDYRIHTRHRPPAPTLPYGLGVDVPIDPDPLDPHPEHPTPVELVVRLTQSERITRVKRLTELAWNRYDQAIDSIGDKRVAAVCSLVSGGNDSYTVSHLFRSVSTAWVHANTGTGIEATRATRPRPGRHLGHATARGPPQARAGIRRAGARRGHGPQP